MPVTQPPATPLEERARILEAQMRLGHRTTASGLESLATWAETLRQRTDLSPAGVERHTELIGRLGQTITRLMGAVQRAVAMSDHLERRSLPPKGEVPRRSRGDGVEGNPKEILPPRGGSPDA